MTISLGSHFRNIRWLVSLLANRIMLLFINLSKLLLIIIKMYLCFTSTSPILRNQRVRSRLHLPALLWVKLGQVVHIDLVISC